MNTLEIFRYKDYQKFLKDLVAAHPKRGWGLLKRWSEATRISTSHLSLVIAKRKDLNVDQALAIARVTLMNSEETDYFLLLIQWSRAERRDLKEYFKEKLSILQKAHLKFTKSNPSDKVLTEEDRTLYYSTWLYSAVRMFTLVESKITVTDVAQRFKISTKKADEIVNRLLRLGLIELTPQGQIFPAVSVLSLDRDSPNLLRHQLNWRLKGIDHLDHLENEELAISFPMAISQKLFTRFSAEILKLIKQLSNDLKDDPADDIACLNVDFFWIK
jgi:uncharacterized protein (TIGR02147 family)